MVAGIGLNLMRVREAKPRLTPSVSRPRGAQGAPRGARRRRAASPRTKVWTLCFYRNGLKKLVM